MSMVTNELQSQSFITGDILVKMWSQAGAKCCSTLSALDIAQTWDHPTFRFDVWNHCQGFLIPGQIHTHNFALKEILWNSCLGKHMTPHTGQKLLS